MTKSGRKQGTLIRCLCDALQVLPFIVVLLIATEQQASAYTDPGSGALIWQMVAAGFVGLMFYLRKFGSWFRSRKKETKD